MLPPKTPLSGPYYRLLQRLWRQGSGPARVLFRELGMSRTLGDKLVDQMVREGVAGPDSVTGDLALSKDYGSVLGLHIGTKTVTAVVVDFTGGVLLTRDFPYPDQALVPGIQGLVAQMEPFLRPATVPPLRGVAVSLPGIVDPHRLVLIESNPLRIFEPISLSQTLGRALGRPLTAENDANCCCWGEFAARRREKLGNFLFILAEQRPTVAGRPGSALNLGVGFGLFLNGTVYHGSRFSAGEFKSIFKRDWGQRSQFSLPDPLIARSYEDPEVGEAVARELSRNASLLVNILDLDRVLVSWPQPVQAPRIQEILREEIQRNWSYDHPVDCPVELPVLGALAPAYGAAGLHLESLFQTADGLAPYFPGKN